MFTISIVSIVILVIIGISLMWFGDHSYTDAGSFAFGAGIITLIVSAILCIILAMNAYAWYGAQVKANIINREYHTHYTREEIFFASDVIDQIRELDRTRIEVNGNVMRQQEKTHDAR